MKFAVVLLVVLPAVFCAPQKRVFLGEMNSILDQAHITEVFHNVYNLLGADATEQQCETECSVVITNILLKSGCPLVCKSFQAWAHTFGGGSTPSK